MSQPASRRPPPPTRRTDAADDYPGGRVEDPYRWLEEMDSPEVRAWVDAQNAHTFTFLRSIPVRGRIRDRLRAVWNHERVGLPVKRGETLFFTRNEGLRGQDALCLTRGRDAGREILLAWIKAIGARPAP